jgi:hypothetical protein
MVWILQTNKQRLIRAWNQLFLFSLRRVPLYTYPQEHWICLHEPFSQPSNACRDKSPCSAFFGKFDYFFWVYNNFTRFPPGHSCEFQERFIIIIRLHFQLSCIASGFRPLSSLAYVKDPAVSSVNRITRPLWTVQRLMLTNYSFRPDHLSMLVSEDSRILFYVRVLEIRVGIQQRALPVGQEYQVARDLNEFTPKFKKLLLQH